MKNTFTVGYFDSENRWHFKSKFSSKQEAMEQAHKLNGELSQKEIERLTAENARLRAEQRDAFEAGFRIGKNYIFTMTESKVVATIELAWEHFQAERMKAAGPE